jgi:hypothetical protein
MNTQNIKSTPATQTANTSMHIASAQVKTTRTPRYKFDETWIESITRCINNCRDNKNRANDNNGNSHNKTYTADDIKRLIYDYLEGTNDCSELYNTNFGCAWVVIKAEIDRRKARNARARERRLLRRTAAMPTPNNATTNEATTIEATTIEATAIEAITNMPTTKPTASVHQAENNAPKVPNTVKKTDNNVPTAVQKNEDNTPKVANIVNVAKKPSRTKKLTSPKLIAQLRKLQQLRSHEHSTNRHAKKCHAKRKR